MTKKSPDNTELVGQKIGSLTVLRRVENIKRPNGKVRPVYECICDCGNVTTKESQTLRTYDNVHCGCLTSERLSKSKEKRDKYTVMTRWKAYSSYCHMLGRCYNPKEAGYCDYGERGIIVCDRWNESFWNFLEDMGERPAGFVIDRIDPNGNYCPENCRWVDRSLSSFNTRKAKNNTSGRTGVYWFDRVSKWVAAIFVEKKQKHLGYFDTYEGAVAAREKAEITYFGENKL